MSDNGSDIGAFMAGFVIGGLVGAATALILAPQSGADTRAQIASRGDELWHSGEQQFVEYREKAQGRVQDTSDQIQERARIVLEEGDRLSDVHGTPERELPAADSLFVPAAPALMVGPP